MTEKYNEGQAVSINPSKYDTKYPEGTFAALVKVVGSRYGSTDYDPTSGFTNKIVIKWTLLSTKGNQFEKKYSTGIPIDAGLADISPDGKRLISRSAEFRGYNNSSDALLLIRKAIAAGFPEDKVTDDISVFEGACFFVVDDTNPSWKGSAKKAYPKEYHAEGWEAALAARQQNQYKPSVQKAPQANAGAPVSSYTPPQVILAGDVLTAASGALLELVAAGPVKRAEIPAKLNSIATDKGWKSKLRQDITLALWDLNSLIQVANTVGLKVEGETVSFK